MVNKEAEMCTNHIGSCLSHAHLRGWDCHIGCALCICVSHCLHKKFLYKVVASLQKTWMKWFNLNGLVSLNIYDLVDY